ncbi:hypothetical protein RND81_01G187900 [Saponaria officinalis]|uniref:C2H2-type domain-containing protein n=1 Tax=Saponaria officinalis TaxID=3572 RepID=A0AAW1NH68_SAPOF
MEKHRCKLCYRKFSNGRALGGHMRSHMMNLQVSTKPESRPSYESFSSSSSSDSEPEEGEIVRDKLVGNLRKKPRKMVKFSFHDRGSDTESSKTVARRRSSRSRKIDSSSILDNDREYVNECYKNINNNIDDEQFGSSISEVTSEEDVAFCLMMMSRDTWNDNGHGYGYGSEYRYEPEKEFGKKTDTSNIVSMSHKKKYKCETCNKVFKSYQALGGHRASHKKTRVTVPENVCKDDDDNNVAAVVKDEEKKIHECPICFRVFASGQALGGHKRSHVIPNNSNIDNNNNNNQIKSRIIVQSPKKMKSLIEDEEVLIDLNLPAPVDDDDNDDDYYGDEFISQIDTTSGVSDVHLCSQS